MIDKVKFAQKIPQLNGVYLIFSTATRCPYVVCNPETYDDEAIVCLTEGLAANKVSELRSEDIPVSMTRIEKDAMLIFFTEMFGFGINAVRFIDLSGEICLQLEEFVKRNDMSEVPEINRPLENPILQLSMLYFTQEVRCKNRDMRRIRELEEEMVVNIHKSTFLVPVMETGEVNEKGQKEIKFMVIRSQDKEPVVPVFTDTVTLSHFLGVNKTQVVKLNIEQLYQLEVPDATRGYLFNPNSVGLVLNKDQLARIIRDF